ncbi:MAG: flavodoxin family protein [candidate division FCPU426 bacterium]
MSSKVLLLVGSRDHQGRAGKAAAALADGLASAGAVVGTVYLLERNIQTCIQRGQDGFGMCLDEGWCKLEDGFAELVNELRAADAVAFVTPVYWGDLSECTRSFLDRLRRIGLHPAGKQGIQGKPALGVCVAGGQGGGSVNCCDSLQRVLGHCEFDVLDMIPARKQNLEHKLKVLKMTGAWFASELAGRKVVLK